MSELDNNSPAMAAWRTVILTAFMLLLVSACFAWGVHHGFDLSSAQAFGALCLCGTGAVTSVALKALGEHLGNGSGIKGALSALVNDTKPGDSAPGKQP